MTLFQGFQRSSLSRIVSKLCTPKAEVTGSNPVGCAKGAVLARGSRPWRIMAVRTAFGPSAAKATEPRRGGVILSGAPRARVRLYQPSRDCSSAVGSASSMLRSASQPSS